MHNLLLCNLYLNYNCIMFIYVWQCKHVFCLRHSDTLEVYGSKINGRRYPIKFKTRSFLLKVLAESIKTSLCLTLITRKYNNIRSRWYIIWRYIFFRHILYENKKRENMEYLSFQNCIAQTFLYFNSKS